MGWFGPRSVAPPAAPVCWALVGSLLRRYVALGYGAPSPSVVSRWVSSFGVCSDLGWYAAVLPGFLPSFFLGGGGGTLLPLSWLFSLGGSYSVVVQAP